MMKLLPCEIRNITLGAERVEEDGGIIKFFRFTKEQEELYIENPDLHRQVYANAGIRLSFVTDSQKLSLKGSVFMAAARGFYSIEILRDKERIGFVSNFDLSEMKGDYIAKGRPVFDFSQSYDLGDGKKTVDIYLPWSAGVALEELSVDNGAFLEGVKCDKKLLAFGDSITQGYDALMQSQRYTSLLSKTLGAEEYNKAIGGAVFLPSLAKSKETFVPDYITVAYGTNDWSFASKEDFMKNCKAFYEGLSETYPSSKIFAISPIWRKDADGVSDMGQFPFVAEYIEKVAKELSNVTFIDGYDLVPHKLELFADLYLHPNDEGFKFQANSLYKKIERYL